MKIKEINTGILIINNIYLKKWINKINNNNLKLEFYITDIINLVYKDKKNIKCVNSKDLIKIKGVNNHL
ncbi:hypothetical protein GJU05_02010 [Enterobacteriaceae endosymbiont of Donacia fulgens]|uniref:hypothetical protein n=1 Tax=Enterobacteriaceae endosymbiont of Donacia fulgens TaxID=2675778 RepID=UPI0014490B0E|nr:hypothetical protein [Enterobacteriaceae endosymbiont of Donacia fulgens]QJC38721.1 hypothetical protein GJU05_02010 [Enterobacteriaceae endosymbiont of Donacia fulgens]